MRGPGITKIRSGEADFISWNKGRELSIRKIHGHDFCNEWWRRVFSLLVLKGLLE
jgi:hypothetical protein